MVDYISSPSIRPSLSLSLYLSLFTFQRTHKYTEAGKKSLLALEEKKKAYFKRTNKPLQLNPHIEFTFVCPQPASNQHTLTHTQSSYAV